MPRDGFRTFGLPGAVLLQFADPEFDTCSMRVEAADPASTAGNVQRICGAVVQRSSPALGWSTSGPPTG
jgi:hypothetical protein